MNSRQNSASALPFNLYFKTDFWLSLGQIFLVCFFFLLVGILIPVVLLPDIHVSPGFYPRIGVLLICLLNWYVLGSFVLSWFQSCYSITLKDEKIIGKNLFGKITEINYSEIINIKRWRGKRGLVFSDVKGRKFIPNPSLDYVGFLLDFVILNSEKATKDDVYIESLRAEPNFWIYTRRAPKRTIYPDGYLARFEKEVKTPQLEKLRSIGVLKSDIFYGETDEWSRFKA